MANPNPISPADIHEAADRLRGHIRRTPMEHSPALSARTSADVWLKCECFQETGSFKLRGAINRLLTLDEAARARGVVTASAGNHALGVAESATRLGIRATIVVPETASAAKLHALERYSGRGVELVRFGQDYDAAEAHGLQLAEQTSRHWVSPYNDPAVIAGGGTVALEALEDVPDANVLIVPVGGGGLISGCGIWAKHVRPGMRMVGAEPQASPALEVALAAGHLVTVPVAPTLADGLAGNIEAGSMTFALAQQVVDEMALVSEEEIADAMRWLLAEHHILVEGSAAVSVAALLGGHVSGVDGQRVVAVLTGRNVAYETLRRVVCTLSPA